MSKIRGKLTYSNVVATLALFLVLAGGSAFAATKLAKNSVGATQLKNGAVTTAKIKNGAVTGAKVKTGSLLASDFGAGQIPAGPKGETGQTGPRGSEGQTGSRGPEGPAGTALAYATVEANGTLNASQSKGITSSQVSRESTGTYCFKSIPAEAKSAVGTAYTSGQHNTTAYQFVSIGFAVNGEAPGWTGCSSGSDPVRVTMFNAITNDLADQEFTIWFEG